MSAAKVRPRILKTASPSTLERHFDNPRPRTVVPSSRKALCETDAEKLALAGRLGPTPIGGIFGETSKRRLNLPKTQLQKDLEKSAIQVPEDGYDYVAREEEFHPFKGFTRAQTAHEEKPKTLDLEETRLLRPHERVQNLQFLKKNDLAKKMIRKAKLDRRRLIHLMQKQHPNGVVGLDTPSNMESEVYGMQARKIVERESRASMLENYRRDRLELHTCAARRIGYQITEHSNRAPVTGTIVQKKHAGETLYNPKFHDTHKRVFYQRKRLRNFARQQNIVNMGTNGRDYNIITGTFLPNCARPNIPEKVNRRKLHPSHAYEPFSHP